MHSIHPLVLSIYCVGFLTGCNADQSQNAQQITLSEVIFLIPPNSSVTKSEELEHGAIFEFEGLWGELSDRRLVVMGENYGEVKAGDEVRFELDGTVSVNGSHRKSAGVGNCAVKYNGIVFYFPGRNITKSKKEDGTPIVELPDGVSYN